MKLLIIFCTSLLAISCSQNSQVIPESWDTDIQSSQSVNPIDSWVSTFTSQEVSIDTPVDSSNPSPRP